MIKRIVVCYIFVTILVVVAIGCDKKESKDEPVSFETVTFNQVLSEAAQRFEDEIDVNYNAGLTRTLTDKEFMLKGQGGSSSRVNKPDTYTYGYNVMYTGELIEDANVKSIKYTLSNCIGSFVDAKTVVKDNNKKESIINMKSVPYVLDGSDQSDVVFVVYYCYDSNLSINDQKLRIQECTKYLRITAEVTYEDDSKKTYMYGIDYKYETSVDRKNIQIYRLN